MRPPPNVSTRRCCSLALARSACERPPSLSSFLCVSRLRSAPADMLFMGSKELANPDTPGTFGSVASAVAAKVSCSVLIIKPDTN